MNKLWVVAGITLAVAGCGGADAGIRDTQATVAAPPGTVAEATAGKEPAVAPRTDHAATPATEPPAPVVPVPVYREVTLPTGTTLPVELRTAVASDTSQVEDQIRGTLSRAVLHDGTQVLPAGTVVAGHVTAAHRAAKVKGRASIGLRFTQIDLAGDNGRTSMATATISRMAPATKKKDAAKIGGAAAGGAIIGAILGGGDGAAKGAVIGGGAGTGVVLATRGEDVRMAAGTALSVTLTAPLVVRVVIR